MKTWSERDEIRKRRRRRRGGEGERERERERERWEGQRKKKKRTGTKKAHRISYERWIGLDPLCSLHTFFACFLFCPCRVIPGASQICPHVQRFLGFR